MRSCIGARAGRAEACLDCARGGELTSSPQRWLQRRQPVGGLSFPAFFTPPCRSAAKRGAVDREAVGGEPGGVALTHVLDAIMSCQSLNEPFLRSSRILAEIPGPMPLIDSSSAWVALLASTAPNAAAAHSASMAVRNLLVMGTP